MIPLITKLQSLLLDTDLTASSEFPEISDSMPNALFTQAINEDDSIQQLSILDEQDDFEKRYPAISIHDAE